MTEDNDITRDPAEVLRSTKGQWIMADGTHNRKITRIFVNEMTPDRVDRIVESLTLHGFESKKDHSRSTGLPVVRLVGGLDDIEKLYKIVGQDTKEVEAARRGVSEQFRAASEQPKKLTRKPEEVLKSTRDKWLTCGSRESGDLVVSARILLNDIPASELHEVKAALDAFRFSWKVQKDPAALVVSGIKDVQKLYKGIDQPSKITNFCSVNQWRSEAGEAMYIVATEIPAMQRDHFRAELLAHGLSVEMADRESSGAFYLNKLSDVSKLEQLLDKEQGDVLRPQHPRSVGRFQSANYKPL